MRSLVVACCLVIGAAGGAFVWAQGVQVPHGPPNSVAAPAMSLKNLPVHPAEASGQVPKLTLSEPSGHAIHIMATPEGYAARAKAGLSPPPGGRNTVNNKSGVLNYHSGGSVMPYQLVYPIFWAPSQLQTGAATGFSNLYGTIGVLHSAWLPGNGLLNIATQYYQTIGGVTSYIVNAGYLAGYYVDTTNPYPASGCTDTATAGNCITDAQIRTEIAAVMTANGWTGGMNKIFILYTSAGEGSCFGSGPANCAYTAYCAYHSFFSFGGQPVIYANIPYANTNRCFATGTQTLPNQDSGDVVTTAVSHEMIEAATDPLLNAWFDATGNEIGDLCNFNFGTNTWTNPANGITANQSWNGWYFEDQMEYSNHTANCLQVGP